MRYSEFKPINEGFWDSILDITTGGPTDKAAHASWLNRFSQKLSNALEVAIRGGTVNPRVPGTIDPSTKKSTNTTPNRNDRSIAEYVYDYLENIYKIKSVFDDKTLALLINSINQVENNYSRDRGKNAIKQMGEIIYSDALSSREKPAPAPAPEPPDNTPRRISPEDEFPKKDISGMKAKVGDNIVTFNFKVASNTWTDQSGKPVVDAKSIKALNGLSKLGLKSPFPTKNLTLNTTTGKYIFFRGKWYKERIAPANLENDNDIIDQLNKLARP